jgi:hypothetical protein
MINFWLETREGPEKGAEQNYGNFSDPASSSRILRKVKFIGMENFPFQYPQKLLLNPFPRPHKDFRFWADNVCSGDKF